MRAVVQRVSRASVTVENEVVAEIGKGFLLLLGVGLGDGSAQAEKLALKVAKMRIFTDSAGKMNLGLMDVGGSVLCVSQFTLMADTKKGNRPSFIEAARGEVAEKLYEEFCRILQREGISLQQGVFGAHMQVELLNDGPVTLILEA